MSRQEFDCCESPVWLGHEETCPFGAQEEDQDDPDQPS
jgi:hypothetical protein